MIYYFGLALCTSAIYMIAASGASVSLKAGQINLAGEGLIYTGGFLCAICLNFFGKYNINAFVSLSASFILAAVAGGLLMLLCEYLHKKKNADFLLTSFILSSAIIPIIDGLIAGPFRTSSGNLLATSYILEKYRFKSILKPSPLNITFFIAIIFCIALYFALKKTSYGKMLQIYGISPEFSLYSGLPCKEITYSAAFISGSLYCVAGATAVCGTYFTCHSGFYTGIGWNSLSVAMIAKGNPIFVIPASIFMGILMIFSDRAALFSSLNFDLNTLIQAGILFMISILYKDKNE